MGNWKPIGSEALRSHAGSIVRQVAERLRDVQKVRAHGEQLEHVSQEQGWTFLWEDASIEIGFAGQCLLFGELSGLFPEEDWDAVGHQFLLALREALEQKQAMYLSLFGGGLVGVGMAAYALSRQGERYTTFLKTIDQWILTQLPLGLQRDLERFPELNLQAFESNVGWAGVGRYLLLRLKEPGMREALCDVLSALVQLCGHREYQGQTIPCWFMTSEQLREQDGKLYPEGYFNVGLAHGIPGPLVLMALSLQAGVEVPGQRAAMREVVEFLERWKWEDAYGIEWPARITWQEFMEGQLRPSGRAAWCYGTPGVARAIYLAGEALGEASWKALAVEAFQGIIRRPQELWKLHSPSICHGYAGLLQMTMRMYADTRRDEFATFGERLGQLVLDAYDSEVTFGYLDVARSTDGRVFRRDLTGFLEGATGIALVLLSLQADQEPFWDTVLTIC